MNEDGNGLAFWSEASEEIRQIKAQLAALKAFIEGHDEDLKKQAEQRFAELTVELARKERELEEAQKKVTRRELERTIIEQRYPYWRKLVLVSRAVDTPDFEHFARMFVEELENAFEDKVLLWFAGFPITGRLADAGKDRNHELQLKTTLYFRATDEALFGEVERWMNREGSWSYPSWFDEWRTKVLIYEPGASNLRFQGEAWKNQGASTVEEPAEVEVETDLEPQPDDLYIAADDGRMYVLRSKDYRPRAGCKPDWKDLQAKETSCTHRVAKLVSAHIGRRDRRAEKQLARRMIDTGVSLAAIPSTGLPTRGSYCYLVNLAPDAAAQADRK